MYATVSSCCLQEIDPHSKHFRIGVHLGGEKTRAMLDSGATGLFVNRKYAAKRNLPMFPLHDQLPLYNIDGTSNKAGTITHFCQARLVAGDHDQEWDFLVTDLGPEDLILGLPWLRAVNPKVDWEDGTVELEAERRPHRVEANRKTRRSWVRAGVLENGDELWMCAGYTYSQRIAEEAGRSKAERTLEDMIPAEYRKYQ